MEGILVSCTSIGCIYVYMMILVRRNGRMEKVLVFVEDGRRNEMFWSLFLQELLPTYINRHTYITSMENKTLVPFNFSPIQS